MAKPYFSRRAYCKLKTSVAASRNIAWFSKREMQLLHYFKTKNLHGPVVIKEGFICKHCKLQDKKNLINRSFSFLSQWINYLARTKKKLIYVWVGAIPVCGEIHETLQSLVVRLNWLNKFFQGSFSADAFFIAGISLNDVAEQARLCLFFIM